MSDVSRSLSRSPRPRNGRNLSRSPSRSSSPPRRRVSRSRSRELSRSRSPRSRSGTPSDGARLHIADIGICFVYLVEMVMSWLRQWLLSCAERNADTWGCGCALGLCCYVGEIEWLVIDGNFCLFLMIYFFVIITVLYLRNTLLLKSICLDYLNLALEKKLACFPS